MTRSRTILIALASLLALGVLGAGCGGSSEQPASSGALVVDSARAVKAQKPARLRLDLKASADEIVPAAGAGPQVRQFAGAPSTVRLSGGFSPEAIDAKGSANFLGQTFTADAMAGARELYVRFLGQWYGTKQFGLQQLQQRAEQQGGRSSDQAFNEFVSNVERYGDQIFKGQVSEGPELDGDATWQTEGSLNVDGLLKLAREKGGQQVTPQDRAALEKIAQGTQVTYVVGQDDKLPRRLRLTFDIRPAEFANSPGVDNPEQLRQVERVRASFNVDMSAWGEPVEIRPPANFQPIEQLAQRFLGGAVGGGATPGQ